MKNNPEQVKSALEYIPDNNDEVSEKLGIKRGKPMTFEQADGAKGNINYNKNNFYRKKCQCFVVSNELRRRGFDVNAKPNKDRYGIPYMLSHKTEKAWIDPQTGEVPIKDKTTSNSSKNILPKLLKHTEKRRQVQYVWKNRRYGHIISLERLKNGSIRVFDPQIGKQVDVEKLL